MTFKVILEEAGKLSTAEKAELIDELLCNMGPEALKLTAAQAKDLEMRTEELRSGRAELIDGDEAFEQLRRRK
jgi:putative addiction module component (TIGR02574 family)